MSPDLNVGQGRCQGNARLLLEPVHAVIELGASGDVLIKVLNAVHHANRQGSLDDFIAVALPSMRMGRNCMLPGHEIELIGSETSLASFISLEGPQSLRRRGMLKDTEVDETFFDPDMNGAAYIRERFYEKRTEGWLRRNKARAERRGKPWRDKTAGAKANDRPALALSYGAAVIHVRQVIAEVTDTPLMVSTYGFSRATQGCHAVLPVLSEAAREADDAA